MKQWGRALRNRVRLGLASRTDTFNKGQYVQGVSDDQKEKAV